MKWLAEPKLDRAKVGGVDGYRPHMSLLAGQVHYLSATTPLKVDKPPWCCPRQAQVLETRLHELVRGLKVGFLAENQSFSTMAPRRAYAGRQ